MLTITPHAMDAPVSRHAFRATFNLVLQTIALFNINSTRGTLTHSDDCGRHGLERIPLQLVVCRCCIRVVSVTTAVRKTWHKRCWLIVLI